ncbi:membrane-bound alkaline phosphatase-like [Teleopsis dalmanni]|uniref:membrane-bound alkaline phosphatase-like n=1 Tax=Teleopsis dalmanni TaxID=139649 RepID=UPI0018CDDD49|nr:membrane-bound alkaline phosphatase-like [Teleopsis dalmanni]
MLHLFLLIRMEGEKSFHVFGKKTLKSSQIFIVASIILMTLIITIFCIGFLMRYEVDTDVSNVASVHYWKDKLTMEQKIWFDKGIKELEATLSLENGNTKVKNVIIFVVNGIHPTSLAAVRFLNQNETIKELSWEKFPYMARLKSNCNHLKICDPFTRATALFGGVQTNDKVGGLDTAVPFQNCTAAANQTHHIKSVLAHAQDKGLNTGFITENRVTGPIIAALYAHTPDTNWECDASMPKGELTQKCWDIAQQLILSETGKKLNVIMGGGRQTMVTNSSIDEFDKVDVDVCNSVDGRNLLRDWQQQKQTLNLHHKLLMNAQDLNEFSDNKTDYLLGIFTNNYIKSDMNSKNIAYQMPTLKLMMNKSLDVLKRNARGYLLVVETGDLLPSDVETDLKTLIELDELIAESTKSSR